MRAVSVLVLLLLPFGCSSPPKGGPDEVYISGGDFTMGHDPFLPEPPACTMYPTDPCNDFAPRHKVTLDPFFIDKTEVSVGEYKKCVADGFCAAPDLSSSDPLIGQRYADPASQDFPMVGVRWTEATQFCQSKGRRLPTEAEWERAARGTNERDFPWGNTAPACDKIPDACPRDPWNDPGWDASLMRKVGTTPADKTPEGVLDLYGNARELVNDVFSHDYYGHSPQRNPTGPDASYPPGATRVVRGGGYVHAGKWADPANGAPSWGRDFDSGRDGFRCARSVTVSGRLPRYQAIAWRVLK